MLSPAPSWWHAPANKLGANAVNRTQIKLQGDARPSRYTSSSKTCLVDVITFPPSVTCPGIYIHLLVFQGTCGLVAMTSAQHAEGRQFNPGQVYDLSETLFVESITIQLLKLCGSCWSGCSPSLHCCRGKPSARCSCCLATFYQALPQAQLPSLKKTTLGSPLHHCGSQKHDTSSAASAACLFVCLFVAPFVFVCVSVGLLLLVVVSSKMSLTAVPCQMHRISADLRD